MEGLTCPNPDCRVAETGKCVEGFSVGECPHQQKVIPSEEPSDAANDVAQHSSPPKKDTKEEFVASGEILNIDDATDILCRGTTRVMTVIGPNKSGKTTLGISLYDVFQHGPFDRWSFSGSMTLVAFEKRCHLARSISGKSKPDTQRTSLSDGLGLLHLGLYCDEYGRIDLLISDRSGEFYTAVADNLEDCNKLHEVSRADNVLFLIDGEKLVSDERHGALNDARMMIKTLIEGEKIGKNHQISIVLTKYDIVSSSKSKDRAEKDFENFVNKLEDTYSKYLAKITPYKIAARSETDDIESCYGVLDILEETLRQKEIIKHISTSTSRLDRCFLNLQEIKGSEE